MFKKQLFLALAQTKTKGALICIVAHVPLEFRKLLIDNDGRYIILQVLLTVNKQL